MKILLTGGLGFIGSAVVRMAVNQGHTVVNIDALTYASCLDNVSNIIDNKNYFFEKVNICHRTDIDKVFKKYNPDVVMHLAAETHVDRSITDPKKFIETNIIGTFNMLESSRAYWELRGRNEEFRFHYISTDEVYGSLPSDTNLKFTENTPYDPSSPYSASKASGDHLVRAWFKTYGLPIIITNCSNNYGPYQFPEKLIPVAIINSLYERPIPIYGNGSHIRDWLYVEDHANALLLVLKKGKIGRSYNIGGNNEMANLEVVKMLCNILDDLKPRSSGKYYDLIEFVKDRPGHDTRYAIDTSLISKELCWSPSVNIKIGLKKTIEWFLANQIWWKPLLDRSAIRNRLGKKIDFSVW